MVEINYPASPGLRTRTTYELIRPVEAVALMLQAANLAMSLTNEQYRPEGRPIIATLAIAHLVAACLVLRYRGPLTRGYAWAAVWIAMMFVMQILIANLLVPGDFGGHGYGIQVGNLVLIPLALLAFYPWGGFQSSSIRWLIEISLIVTVILHPLFILAVMHRWRLGFEQYESVFKYAVWAVVWYLVGKGIARLCQLAARSHAAALVRSYETALGDFHSYVDDASRAIAAGQDMSAVAQRLRDITYRRRLQLMMEDQHVAVVDLVKNAVSLFGDRLTVVDMPRIGALTLQNDIAMVFERALVDLLANVVRHGDGVARLDLDLRDDTVELTVQDDGPGMNRRQFDHPESSVRRLRESAQHLGGDLILAQSSSGAGTTVALTLPLRSK